MQIVDEQIKLARLRCNLTLRKLPWRMPQQKEVPPWEPLIVWSEFLGGRSPKQKPCCKGIL